MTRDLPGEAPDAAIDPWWCKECSPGLKCETCARRRVAYRAGVDLDSEDPTGGYSEHWCGRCEDMGVSCADCQREKRANQREAARARADDAPDDDEWTTEALTGEPSGW